MRTRARALRPIAVIGIGLLLALMSAAVSQPSMAREEPASLLVVQATHTPAAQGASEIGSTDGIMLMSVVIVLIVIVPILVRRKIWMR
jgi:hypothetical protein